MSLPSSSVGGSEGRFKRGHYELNVTAGLVQEVPQNGARDYVGTLGASAIDGLAD